MVKSIGIFTLHRAMNYGAVLQCYALKTVCEKFGHKVETIDFNPFGHYTYRRLLRHKPFDAISAVMQFRNFNMFVGKYLNPTQHTEDHSWITDNLPKNDVFIVGSDTVWCENTVGPFINSYLLDFIPDNVVKIAYAASIGGGETLSPNYQRLFAEKINSFKAISVREKASIPPIQSLYNKAVADVCDPTLLLTKEDYLSIEQKHWKPNHYIIIFDLADDPLTQMIAREYKVRTGYPIINISPKKNKCADFNFSGISPNKWLYLIHHCDCLCTNSFHGVAFSIIYRKPFICNRVQKGGRSKANGRVENLLSQTGLSDRYIIKPGMSPDFITLDYSNYENNINTYRMRSLDWLKHAII